MPTNIARSYSTCLVNPQIEAVLFGLRQEWGSCQPMILFLVKRQNKVESVKSFGSVKQLYASNS